MYIVSQDGSGDWKSVQQAIDHAPTGSAILIRAGIYRERVIVYKDGLRLIGESREDTVVTFSACAKDLSADGVPRGTFLSFTLLVTGRNVTVENLTVRNDAGDGEKAGQAVAVYAAGDRCAWKNCRLIAHQDTLFCGPLMPKVQADIAPYDGGSAECVESVGDCPTTRSRVYFEDCFIRGDVDVIFGPYRCWFERCTLFMNARGGWYTAANTPEEQPYGLVFHACRLTGDCEEGKALLGRPWRRFARTVFLACDMDAHVSPSGFADWDETRKVTERYAEWNTSNVRSDLSARHPAQKRLTDAEAEAISMSAVIGGGDGWNPAATNMDKTDTPH